MAGCLTILTGILGIFFPPLWILTIACALMWALSGGKKPEVHNHYHTNAPAPKGGFFRRR